jgi:D-alanine-D-alanine ligase
LLGAGVSTPRSITLDAVTPAAASHLRYPLIVKPTREDASVGISRTSVVANPAELEAQLRHVLVHYNQPAIIEEYIVGREINAAILDRVAPANGDAVTPQVLPLHEIDFSEMPADRPKIVSFEAKWVEDSPDYRGTRPVPCQLTDQERARVVETALAAWKAIGLRDYGRVDLRLAADGTPYVIDINPNCDLSSDGGGFARAARAAGLSYPDLVLRLLSLALERRKDADTIPLSARSRGADVSDRSAGLIAGADVVGAPLAQSVSAGRGGVRHRTPRGGAGTA